MFKKTLYFIFIIIFALWQISFLSQFNFFNKSFNLILVFIILITLIKNYKNALLTAIISGLIFDLFSVFGFGIYTLAFLSSVLITNYLFKKYFARRSSFSIIIIMVSGTLVYHLVILIFSSLAYWLNWNNFHLIINGTYLISLLNQIFFNTLILLLIFILSRYFLKKFRLKFLISEKLDFNP